MQSENPNSKPLAPTEKTPTQKTDVCAPAPHLVSKGGVELPIDKKNRERKPTIFRGGLANTVLT